MTRFGIAAAALAAAAVLTSAPAQSTGFKRQGTREAATQVADAVTKAHKAKVRVGKFDAPELSPAAGGAFAREVEFALTRLGVFDPQAEAEVGGTIATKPDVTDAAAKVAWVQPKLAVGKAAPAPLPEVEIRFNTDLAQLVSASGAVGRKGNYAARNKEIFQLRTTPTAALRTAASQVVAPTADSLYGVEVIVWRPETAKSVARETVVEKGQATVRTQPGDEFQLKLWNYDEAEVAVAVALDGLDVLSGNPNRTEEGRGEVSHFLVPAAKGGKPGAINVYRAAADPVTKRARWVGMAAPPGTAGQGVGTVHLAFSPATPLGGVQFPPDTTLTCVGPDGKPTKRGTDVPFEFLTIQYQR